MNHAVTTGDLLHWSLMILFVLSLLGVPWFWLNVFAAGMSDGAPPDRPWKTWMAFAHGLPVVLIAAWWLT